jgi:lipopolysaccharide/colanic/teichoic acid biosynthesis glycosyltransferase
MRNALARIVAALSLLALGPVLLLVALTVFLAMGSPVLFRQQRSGLAGSRFTLLKFRSMREATGRDGRPLPDEERVTRLGRFLRRSRLDELPGLFNIVKGDLALVGPRPLLPETIAELGERGRRRGCVRPGLTGWSQVNGNTRLSLDRKIDLDLWYIGNRSWGLDLQIILKTLAVMVFGERETPHSREVDGTGEVPDQS